MDEAKKQNKITASKKGHRHQSAASSANSARRVHAAPRNVETDFEERRVPIAPVVPPPKKGLLKRLFGRGKSKKTFKKGNQAEAGSSTGSKKKQPFRIQVDPPSKGSIRGMNPAKSGSSTSTRAMSHSTDGGKSKTKMYCQPVTQNQKANDTAISMAAARSIASSHHKHGTKLDHDYEDVGFQFIDATAQSKGSSNKASLQQQESAASSAIRFTAPNKIFFPDKAVGARSSGGSSGHSGDASTKFYSRGGTALQSQLSSHEGGSSGSFPQRTFVSSSSSGSSRHSGDGSTKFYSTSGTTLQSRLSSQAGGSAGSTSSSFDRRVESAILVSPKRANAYTSAYSKAIAKARPNSTAYPAGRTNSTVNPKARTNPMKSAQSSQRPSGSRQSGQGSKAVSHHKKRVILRSKDFEKRAITRSDDVDWNPDPRMPDPWVDPRRQAINKAIIRESHRGNSSRPPQSEGHLVATSFFNLNCF